MGMRGVVGSMELGNKLESFLGNFNIEDICDRLENEESLERDYVKDLLGTFANETRVTLSLVEQFLNSRLRILEVGAGICLFSIFLKSENYDVVALEPALGGFSDFEKIKNAVLGYYSHIALDVLRISAQDLGIHENGEFDLIYSNNVIEHIPELSSTFSAMTNVLSENGLMVHACPNYLIPYEPHFGIPVFKLWPGLSRRVFSKRIASKVDLWDSLNFISYFNVKVLASDNHLRVKFVQGVLSDSVVRLQKDESFRGRHMNRFLLSLFSLLKGLRILHLLQYLPPFLSTPMIVLLFREGHEPLLFIER